MFTVTFGLEESGNSSTRSPLGKLYSVMPSTEAPLRTPSGKGCAEIANDTASAWKRRSMALFRIRDELLRLYSNQLIVFLARAAIVITYPMNLSQRAAVALCLAACLQADPAPVTLHVATDGSD